MENDKIQLREFFPNTSIGGELFEANYCGENQFVKIFYQEIDKPYTNESLTEINDFLSKNGYGYNGEDRLTLKDFDNEEHRYNEFPISIGPIIGKCPNIFNYESSNWFEDVQSTFKICLL